jgi:AbiV family abortive infection protein
MRARAIRDLCQLADDDFLREIAIGMGLVLANANALLQDSALLASSKRNRAARILHHLTEEEAAKVLILLDAVRCPRGTDALSRQLARFNDHLAKGIYAEYVGIKPATYREALQFIDHHRREYYLDGPNDVDWIFRNWILETREESLYVDHVDTDDGHLWLSPLRFDDFPAPTFSPAALRLSQLLSDAGVLEPPALATIAQIWRPVRFAPDDHWDICVGYNRATLEALDAAGLLSETGAENAGTIAWEWLFPLHDVDLSMAKIDRGDLRNVQAEWTPDL